MEQAMQMAINSCRDYANFTEQTFTECSFLYTKDNKPPVSCGHMLALPLT